MCYFSLREYIWREGKKEGKKEGREKRKGKERKEKKRAKDQIPAQIVVKNRHVRSMFRKSNNCHPHLLSQRDNNTKRIFDAVLAYLRPQQA